MVLVVVGPIVKPVGLSIAFLGRTIYTMGVASFKSIRSPPAMNQDLVVVLALLLTAVVLFVRNKPRMDVVALIMMTALPLTGVIGVQDALAGFADPNIVLIAALFVIGDGLVRTGVAQRIGDWLAAHAGASETRLIPPLMIVVAVIGSIMSSTAVVALFIPVVLRIAQRSGISVRRLMMPLSVAALISGMMTLVATAPNLIVNSELVRRGFEGFQFFSFAPFGVPLLVCAVGYMLLARRWLSPDMPAAVAASWARPRLAQWIDEYGLAEREHRLRVADGSPLVGKTLEELNLRSSAGANIIAVERNGRFSRRVLQPVATTELRAGDVLFLDLFTSQVDIEEVTRRFKVERLPMTGSYFLDRSQELGMVEVMIPASSKLIGQSVVSARFRSEFDLTAIGLRRGGIPRAGSIRNEELKVGDTLLLIGPWRAIRRLGLQWNTVIALSLPADLDDVVPAPARAPHALAVLGVVVALMVSGAVPNVIAALIGCLLLGLLRCIDTDTAYRSIHWQTLVLIVGMMPFAIALQKTGGIDIAASALIGTLGAVGIHAMLAGLFALTAVLGLFISNTATAVLMAPVALAVAEELGRSPYPFAMTVAIAASAAFMTPVSSPVNTLVVGPGKYTFWDFVRVGVPFAVIAMVVSVVLIPWMLPP